MYTYICINKMIQLYIRTYIYTHTHTKWLNYTYIHIYIHKIIQLYIIHVCVYIYIYIYITYTFFFGGVIHFILSITWIFVIFHPKCFWKVNSSWVCIFFFKAIFTAWIQMFFPPQGPPPESIIIKHRQISVRTCSFNFLSYILGVV